MKGLQPVNFKRKLNRVTFTKPALVKILQTAFNKVVITNVPANILGLFRQDEIQLVESLYLKCKAVKLPDEDIKLLFNFIASQGVKTRKNYLIIINEAFSAQSRENFRNKLKAIGIPDKKIDEFEQFMFTARPNQPTPPERPNLTGLMEALRRIQNQIIKKK